MGVQTLKHRREAAGRRVIPAGHSKRTLAVLRRHGVMRHNDRQLRQCELCQKQRRIGRWWWPPRQLVQGWFFFSYTMMIQTCSHHASWSSKF
eukprot:g23029.t1